MLESYHIVGSARAAKEDRVREARADALFDTLLPHVLPVPLARLPWWWRQWWRCWGSRWGSCRGGRWYGISTTGSGIGTRRACRLLGLLPLVRPPGIPGARISGGFKRDGIEDVGVVKGAADVLENIVGGDRGGRRMGLHVRRRRRDGPLALAALISAKGRGGRGVGRALNAATGRRGARRSLWAPRRR
jgi:hypothetical protein